ncbi:MAG: protein-glutamate O-methyltransferase CheR [Actinomycetota bacterium]|nr:protein-glutamate O-methyltransferase CheR [Actinomycetota bacterium]MDQ3771888.1 protein-glutamate O-methyltransferase CheR [Actinomycetota bacterium]
MEHRDLENLEIDLLLEGIYRQYGFDFREYARGSIKRRLWRRIYAERLESISGLQEKVLHDPDTMNRLLEDLSINVTSMFRDPSFYRAVRTKIVPLLRTYPFIRIWNAGCSTGEETYSLAILLAEEGLYDKTKIYATDINETVLELAKQAVFPIEQMRVYTENYIQAGGTTAFSEYYGADTQGARFHGSLSDNIIFAQHNLVSDRSFNEFHMILCRNVMIYFDRSLQDRVHGLFYSSLGLSGILALGRKESIKFTRHADSYEEIDSNEKLYKRVR